MKITTVAALAGLALCSTVAQAEIVILQGPGNVAGDENVLFNGTGLIDTGVLVQGRTNQSSSIVNFFDAGTILTTPGNGQARIEAQTGTFGALSIALNEPLSTYTSLILNINAAADGQVTFNIGDVSDGSVLSQTFDVDKSGQNFFRIVASGDSRINLTSLTTTVGIQDIKQVRLGGAQAVPEPTTLAGIGVAALALLRRKKKA